MKDQIALLNTKHKPSCRLRTLHWCRIYVIVIGGLISDAQAANTLAGALGALQRLDYEGAAGILQRLANEGDARVQAALSNLIESGKLTNDDSGIAFELLTRATEQNLNAAALGLGNRFHLGTGVPRDDEQAAKWWPVAAENGTPTGAFNLGLAYANGLGHEVDIAQATQWFEIAADSGLPDAQFALGVTEIRNKSHARAIDYFETAASAGLGIAQYNLASMLERGLGQPADVKSAINWYQSAAQAGIESASQSLARLGVAANESDALIESPAINTLAWVMAQPGSNLTLQVAFGDSKQATVDVLMSFNTLSDLAYVALPASDAQAQYIAYVGSFSPYLEAISFLNSLDSNLRATSRGFASSQRFARN